MSIHNVSKYELIDTSEFVMGVLLGGRCSSTYQKHQPTPHLYLPLDDVVFLKGEIKNDKHLFQFQTLLG